MHSGAERDAGVRQGWGGARYFRMRCGTVSEGEGG